MASRVMQTLGTPASSMAIENFRKKDMERAKLAEKASDEKEKKKDGHETAAHSKRRGL